MHESEYNLSILLEKFCYICRNGTLGYMENTLNQRIFENAKPLLNAFEVDILLWYDYSNMSDLTVNKCGIERRGLCVPGHL